MDGLRTARGRRPDQLSRMRNSGLAAPDLDQGFAIRSDGHRDERFVAGRMRRIAQLGRDGAGIGPEAEEHPAAGDLDAAAGAGRGR